MRTARPAFLAMGLLCVIAIACAGETDAEESPIIVERVASEAVVAAGAGETGDGNLWPPRQVKVTRDQAIRQAREQCTGSGPEVTPVEAPHDPVARLMPIFEFEDRTGGWSQLHDSDLYYWVVQFEGESHGAGISAPPGRDPPVWRFAGCAIDAEDGAVREGFRRRSEPLLLPDGISPRIPADASEPNLGFAVEASGPVATTRDDAISLVRSRYSLQGWFVDRAEVELVRYTGTCHGLLAGGPVATATPGGPPTPASPSGASPPRIQCGVERGSVDSKDRLTWLVIIPVELELHPCGGKPGMDRHATCWTQQVFALIDAETGEQYGDGGNGRVGPMVTNEELQALTRFAWAEGWWELWHRVKDYGAQPLPDGYAASLDRPDAPTPTPRPVPTAPPPYATATAAPAPLGTPTHTPSPVPSPAGIGLPNPPVVPPPRGPGVEPGTAYPYSLFLHCGVRDATFDGRNWQAQNVPEEWKYNPPDGWTNDDATGTMTLVGPDLAVFKSNSGRLIEFRPGPPAACY